MLSSRVKISEATIFEDPNSNKVKIPKKIDIFLVILLSFFYCHQQIGSLTLVELMLRYYSATHYHYLNNGRDVDRTAFLSSIYLDFIRKLAYSIMNSQYIFKCLHD